MPFICNGRGSLALIHTAGKHAKQRKENTIMKSKMFCLLSLAVAGAFAFTPQPSHAAKIRIVCPLTDLADLARNVGGDHVEVFSLATGIEDTHGGPMKPSFVPIMNRAALLL